MRPAARIRSHEKGTVLILVGISLAVFVGFLGLVNDLGRLFVTKTELQSAMDACALAAAAELRPALDPPDAQAIARAVNAGITAGTRNRAGFQGQQVVIAPGDIYFSDRLSDNSTTFPFGYGQSGAADPATASYALCARSSDGIATWFMHALQAFLAQPATLNTVGAWATATQQPAQHNCAIPIGLCMLPGASAADPFAGMAVGQWLTSKLEASATGSFSWIDFTPPGGGANELAEIIKGNGVCNVPAVGALVGQQGNIESLDKAWNTRFGLYKGADSSATASPDYSGYSYTPANWPTQSNAFGGTSLTGVPNFQTSRDSNMTYQSTPGQGYRSTTSADLATNGADRRFVTAPMVDCSAWQASNPQIQPVLAFACVLMLHPMTHTSDPLHSDETWLEYRGPANASNSGCSTSGLAGGTVGPLVPVLVH